MPAFLFIHMVRKIVFGFGILCGVLIVLLIIAMITGILQFYRIPTTSNEPSIKKGEKIFASNKLEPTSKKFLVFKNQSLDSIKLLIILSLNQDQFIYSGFVLQPAILLQ